MILQKKEMRIIFMGTPDFAVETLKKLVEAEKNIVAVITAPDKPSGRGLKIHETPVKQYAVSQNIPVLQPEKLKNKDFLEVLKSYKADLQIVVAFRMLPEIIWSMPQMGTFNLHGSLLPQYRGAAPINWAVINGETETGVSTFFIEKEIDTGNIIYSESTPIKDTDTAGEVHDKLMHIGADLVLKTVNSIEEGSYPQIPQPMDVELKAAPKLFKENTQIDWQKDAKTIYDFIRGLAPFPSAWTTFNTKLLKVYKTEILNDLPDGLLKINNTEGFEVYSDTKKYLIFKTNTAYISLKTIQFEGKKRMEIDEFLRGFRLM
jgi:methionyl-tRNA formyltransferase